MHFKQDFLWTLRSLRLTALSSEEFDGFVERNLDDGMKMHSALYIYTNDDKGKGKVELLGRLRIGNMDAKAYSQIKAGRITTLIDAVFNEEVEDGGTGCKIYALVELRGSIF